MTQSDLFALRNVRWSCFCLIFWGALAVAVFTFVPGRMLNHYAYQAARVVLMLACFAAWVSLIFGCMYLLESFTKAGSERILRKHN